ncbi:PREDICTED: F-box only protein 3-like [Priapulus caudatus]|uniref:F-box only protein 3-like n=1 Tax=Priapulus caudatus TaxID=37621 RepID=A0ABM1ENE0_PRICU|nr:PREDICTED: F-box only protein 3-like [Priapulus caudatus]
MESPIITLDELPSDVLIYILSHVSFRDIVSCCHQCQRLRSLCSDELLWRGQCKCVWLCDSVEGGSSWKHQFMNMYKEFGKYVNCYRRIKHSWNQIEKYLKEKCPMIYGSLKEGTTEAELAAVEEKMGATLPADLKCSYRIRNGQKLSTTNGLLGNMVISSHYRTEILLPIETAAEAYLVRCPPIQSKLIIPGDCLSSYRGRLVEIRSSISTLTDSPSRYPYACVLCQASGSGGCKNFTDWLGSYADDLERDLFPVVGGAILKFPYVDDCVETTGSFTVRVATCFLPELSSIHPPHFFFTYRITMSMRIDAPVSEICRLYTRHWFITDADGKEETVTGPGVVGEYPVMRPGTRCRWISCTTINTTQGSMRGFFTMKNLKTGEPLQIGCPTFHMQTPELETAAERQSRVTQKDSGHRVTVQAE